MKKNTFLLVLILLSASILGTAIAESEEYTCLAVLYLRSPNEDFYMIFTDEWAYSLSQHDKSRAVGAYLCFSIAATTLLLPDLNGWEDADMVVGVRVTFDKPFGFTLDLDVEEVLKMPDGVALEPKRVELVGEVMYGEIVEVGDDYMLFEANEDFLGKEQSGNHRFSITPDTLIRWYDEQIYPGSGCQVIVDKDGVVLAMQQANG